MENIPPLSGHGKSCQCLFQGRSAHSSCPGHSAPGPLLWLEPHPSGSRRSLRVRRATAKRVFGQAPCCLQEKAEGTQCNGGIGIHRENSSALVTTRSPHVEVSKLPWKGSQQPDPAVGCSETSHWGPPRPPPHSGGPISLDVSMDVTLCLCSRGERP